MDLGLLLDPMLWAQTLRDMFISRPLVRLPKSKLVVQYPGIDLDQRSFKIVVDSDCLKQ